MVKRNWTGEDYDAVVSALKLAYARHKTWKHRRDCKRDDVAKLARQHGLAEQDDKSGIVFCTASIYYAWSIYEGNNGKALLHYRDGGMGWDEMTLLATDKAALESMRQTGLAMGLVPTR